MIRHLPKAPAKRYWVTGNYMFDYRSNEYGLGASFQTLLIGNGKTQLPQIAFFKLRQEAMGKYTNELTVNTYSPLRQKRIQILYSFYFFFAISVVHQSARYGSCALWSYCANRKWCSHQFKQTTHNFIIT